MGKPVAELRRLVSPREFGYWMAYYNIEPFGPLQDSHRAGTVAAVVANVAPGVKEVVVAEDFFPELKAVHELALEDEDPAAIEAREMAAMRRGLEGGQDGE